ncbi:MAG: Gfo/Idh/MocA family protein [Christensenellales bacterium]|jgi:UDP-N-acetyl-2-amino-2-deoxyglucuronate dehydrogenase|nr:Gfo/Idh/MocA family oxidoreductase [Clostridiales bacterium]
MNKKLRFGVIGIGRMGSRHAFNLARGFVRGVKLVAVCDILSKALERSKKYTKAKKYSCYKEMIENEKLDGVIIATEHYPHGEIARYCIEQKVHVLIEKPLTVTKLDADKVVEVAKANPDVIVGVNFNQRSNKMYKKAKKLISSGKLGSIQRADYIITNWYRSDAYYKQGGWRGTYCEEGGGSLINQCVHQLDILQWLIGMPTSITAKTKTVDRNICTENDIVAILEYPEYNCSFSASSHELSGVNRLEIALDKGRIVMGKFFMKVYRHKSQKQVNKETTFGYGMSPSFMTISSYGLIRQLRDLILGQQIRTIKAFAKAIKNKGELLANVEEGHKSVELINAIYLSSWKDAKVFLPIDANEYENALEEKRQEEKNKVNSK